MDRIVTHQPHRPRRANHVGRTRIHRFGATHHHQHVDVDLEPLGPRHSGCDQHLGALESVGGRQHHHPLGSDRTEEAAVEVVVEAERAATLQNHGSRHASTVGPGATSGSPLLPVGNYGDREAERSIVNTSATSHSPITRVGIVGSGIMGSGLAEVAARAGIDAVVRTRAASTGEAVLAGVAKGLAKQVERGKLSDEESQSIKSRISVVTDLEGLSDCDLIIESVVEDMATKKELFVELDRIARPDALLATNTSTLSVMEIATTTKRPESVCGIHFFNPATTMSLVEIIRPLTASDDTIARATAFAEQVGKQPVQVQDHAGFIVNALLFPYLNNAVRMLEKGTASMADIDIAMKGGCNFPMGPFALLDLVGLDTSLAILDALYAEFKDPNYQAVPTLRRLVEAGKLGRKTKSGFFEY
ncbi:MAG: hypothetical protein B7C54_05825 [Acidimicrobiales bacterium mtb01]|nr:hypothetical protein [Actinomycetota bacterium]TEX46712.1 MAG: hypothetical protein B7C54_05825 [Acidimicrobiales bacterium mtb01]